MQTWEMQNGNGNSQFTQHFPEKPQARYNYIAHWNETTYCAAQIWGYVGISRVKERDSKKHINYISNAWCKGRETWKQYALGSVRLSTN